MLALPLLAGIKHRLEHLSDDLAAWEKGSRDFDSLGYSRLAIEAHEQDQYPNAVDVLIDAARDALEWLASNAPATLDAWVEGFVESNVAVLRRLAIHAITVHSGKSADERLQWLLSRVGLYGLSEHHEVRRAVALNYAQATDATRQAVVNAVLVYKLPATESRTAEQRTASSHFDWLSWLLRAKPDCTVAEPALAPIRSAYPAWIPSEHPDFLIWHGKAERIEYQSPWSIEQLLERSPHLQIEELLNFQGKGFDGPCHHGLLSIIKDACQQDPIWAFKLAEVLVERSLWTSDLWSAVIGGLQAAHLPLTGWHNLLAICAQTELLTAHAHDVANLLYALVKEGGKPFALELLAKGNVIALAVWQALPAHAEDDNIKDWLSRAINRPAGVIVEFWIDALSLLMRGKKGAERALPDNYRKWFTMVLQDETSKGGLGRSLLTSQIGFLFGLDEAWARQCLIPLFIEEDQHKFAQAWDGFLVWGQLYPSLVEALMPAFVDVLKRIGKFEPNRRHRFIEFYANLVVFHVEDPSQKLLPDLFKHGSIEDRTGFASYLKYFLRHMQSSTKKEIWDIWLHRYWQDRLEGVPAALDDDEVQIMLDWLPLLEEFFPEAVLLATRAQPIRLKNSGLLFELRSSDLVTRHRTETAELLIYLCKCDLGYHVNDLKKVAERLTMLEPNLRHRLDEALARKS